MSRLSACVLVSSLFVFGCSKAAAPPQQPAPQSTASPPVAGTGRITGKTTPPKAGSFTVVVLEPRSEREFPPQTEKPVMDQVGLTFGPELLFVRTGQPVDFRNSDDTLHNVHVTHEDTREPAFNVAIPTGGTYQHTFKRDGFYHVGCDIHPAMSATVFASTTPFTTLTESDGAFRFDDVPAGAWKVTVYAVGRKLDRDIDVKDGTTEVTVE